MRIAGTLFLVGVSLTCASMAEAATTTDSKDYPGSMCVAEDGDKASALFSNKQGGVFNGATTEDVIVLCPAVRDLRRIGSAQVRVFRNDVNSISCALSTVRSDLTIQAQQFLFSSFGPPAKVQIDFAGQTAPSTGVGSYTLECRLPRASALGGSAGILMYRIVETD